MLIAGAALALALTPISTAVVGRYEGLTWHQWWTTLAVAEPFVLLSIVCGALVNRRQLGLVNRWIRGDRSPDVAPLVLNAAHVLPRRLMISVGLLAGLTSEPFGIVATLHQIHRLRVADFVLLTVGGLFFALWGIVGIWVWLELSYRPILADVARLVPEIEPPRRGSLRLEGKLAIALGATMLVGACYAGSLAARPGEAFTGLWRLILITVGVSAFFAALLVPLFSELLVQPVLELTQATRVVGAGDLSTRLPVIGRDELGQLTQSFNQMMDGLNERADLHALNSALVDELKASRERIVSAGDAARRRVERDLHDGAQQRLVVAHLKVRSLQRQLDEDGSPVADLAHEVGVAVEAALLEFRELAHGVYPTLLDDGVPAALRYAASQSTVPTEFTCDLVDRFRPEVEAAVYFCCVEALQNVAKHAGPDASAWMRVWFDSPCVYFEVRDDGVGFTDAHRLGSSGLVNLSDRVGALGGQLDITSAPGHGTQVAGRIPTEVVSATSSATRTRAQPLS